MRFILGMVVVFILSTSYRPFQNSELDSNPLSLTDTLSTNSIKDNNSFLTKEKFLYSTIDFTKGDILNEEVFNKAFQGYTRLQEAGLIPMESSLLTICDFSLSSNKKRMWIIDLKTGEVLFNTLVAHGKNTGDEFATNFSNIESSLQSSMGFYLTSDTYFGENGYSLRLQGMDEGFNDRALARSIVLHGAKYVSEDFANKHKRIGRSWGCPAVPSELAVPIIDSIKGNNVLFIYYPDNKYLESSKWLATNS